MAKPRIFISSTYYDLKHARKHLEIFIESLGYDSVLFESGDIPFRHDHSIDESCYSEITTCHMLVLIIGGRYGSAASTEIKVPDKETDKIYEQYNSITKKEYIAARDRDIPIFIFVEKNVLAEFNTYKANRDNTSIKWAHVDSINIFTLLEEIIGQKRNNFVRGFENLDEISNWLKDQWAGLFADFLSRKSQETTMSNLSAQIGELESVNKALREYTETILKSVAPDESSQIISKQHNRIASYKLKRFYLEPMINYIVREANLEANAAEIYSAFQKADTLESFLKLCHAGDDFTDKFMVQHEALGRKDFDDLKERYSFSPEDIHDPEPIEIRTTRRTTKK
ncbi:DUF4062 domain-containing protein [Chitinimonas sp. BJYL2]|uniref:DUF4062 domain-containing protein n=1 Tax=Chitinimonas sp. BJYL2 TaxID=2976696 RepID=UPI0022B34FF4|nr:DUF4062 domain-containing protein [Chitinimonas sp. BJYL2]